jgi:hypothetical protein
MWLVAPGLAFLLLAAHFYRAAQWPLMAASIALALLLALPRAWAARLAQVALVLGTLEWVRAAAVLVHERIAFGAPWLRLVLILGAVALFTAASVLVFQASTIRRWYRHREIGAGAKRHLTERPRG